MKNALFVSLLCLTLAGCCSDDIRVKNDKVKPTSPNLFQPPILRLDTGTQVITKDGVYTAVTNEVWHSDARYRDLENSRYFPPARGSTDR